MDARGRTLIAAVFLVTVLFSTANAVENIGSCTVQEFTFGGQTCQRTMMKNLKNQPDLNCSAAYSTLQVCLTDQVTQCVKNDRTLNGFVDQITKLLLLMAYHCGTPEVDVGDINPLIWIFTKCVRESLNETATCYNGFHSVFDGGNNRNDPELCSAYAESKRDCAEVARKSCEGLCNYLVKDASNPFCETGSDPPGFAIREEYSCGELFKDCSRIFVYEKAMECEDEGVELFANDLDHNCVKEEKRNRDCLNKKLENCSNLWAQNTQVLDPDVVTALHGILTNRRMFCEKADLNTNFLSSAGRFLVDCEEAAKTFSDTAENCTKTFRADFPALTTTDSKKTEELCGGYASARECTNDARGANCNFGNEVNNITSEIKNPFCSRGAERSFSTTLYLLVLSVGSLLIIA